MTLRKPRALASGDRLAVVALASAFPEDEFHAGVAELRGLGFEPVHDEDVFAVDVYEAGPPETRARAFLRALREPAVAGIVCVRGGYGSVKTLPLISPSDIRESGKPIVGYSDLTTVLSFCTSQCGTVAFHGPMLAGRFSRGEAGYDRRSFLAAVCEPRPLGELAPGGLEVMSAGDAAGLLFGGTLTQLVASLGTPFAFDPPNGHILFIEDVNERPYRLDRMLTQLRLAGILGRASGIVFGEMVGCDEPGGHPTARDTIGRLLAGFPGPVLFGFPSGHSVAPAITLPLGVRARVVTSPHPALVIEESAVE